MTESSHNVFVDRRTNDDIRNGLATQILFWYDKDKKKRNRTNGIAITMDGHLVIANATCSRKDQFVKAMGRMKVANRIFGHAKKHCVISMEDVRTQPVDQIATFCATVYSDLFPNDEIGAKRAFNAGNVFARYLQEVDRRAKGLLDA